MKIVHINTSQHGGAAIAARRLVKAQLKAGTRAAFVSRSLTIDYDGDKWIDPFFEYKKPSFTDKFAKLIGLTKQAKTPLVAINNKLNRVRNKLTYESMSVPYSDFRVEEHPLVQEADVVHLHWIGQIVDYPSFFLNIKKPIVWTLHDMNPFMGLFHYKQDLFDNERYIDAIDLEVLHTKKQAYAFINKGAIVSPSNWLLEEAKRSSVFTQISTFKTIPNCIDTNLFAPKNKQELRLKRGIDPKDDVFLFSANALDSRRKGTALLVEALNLINTPVTILTQGKGVLETSNPKVKIIPLGHSNDAQELIENYSIADALVLPSLEDNLPNTMVEAMACGLPVISFALGGMKEHIIANRTGKLVTPTTPEALAETMERFCVSKAIYVSKMIRTYAQTNFGEDTIVKAYREVYNRLTN